MRQGGTLVGCNCTKQCASTYKQVPSQVEVYSREARKWGIATVTEVSDDGEEPCHTQHRTYVCMAAVVNCVNMRTKRVTMSMQVITVVERDPSTDVETVRHFTINDG